MKKKVLALMVIMVMALTPLAALTAFADGEESNPEEFMRAREELMLEQMKQSKKSDRYIVKYKNARAKQNTESAVQNAFNAGKAKNAAEKQRIEAKISKFSGREKEELTMLTAPRLETSRKVVSRVESRKGTDLQLDTDIKLTEIISLDEAVDPADFINSFKAAMGNSIEYIQEDIRMEMSAGPEGGDPASGYGSFAGGDKIVAVIDTGVDVTHPALAARVTSGYDFVNNTTDVYDPALGSEQNHGTHISGIIASTAENARIMPLKVFESGTAYTSDIIAAIEYAEANGAGVVNCSWGATDNNQALREAMENSSMFFVCAAGNSRLNLSQTPIYPAAFNLSNTISVASLNQDLGMSYYSNYGLVDIAAKGRGVSSTVAGGGYGEMNGTSMAAAFVSAAAALVNTGDIKNALTYGADKLSCLSGKVTGANHLNIGNLLNGTAGQALSVTPEDDFDRWFEKTPDESWELFNSSPTVQIASGGYHTVALKANGTVFAWGANWAGQLGDGSTVNKYFPTQVTGLSDIEAIAAGSGHTVALKTGGYVYAWGTNDYGQIGKGSSGSYEKIPWPVSISATIQAIAAGSDHTVAVDDGGNVRTWGRNYFGQLGLGYFGGNAPWPSEIILSNIQDIAAGGVRTAALDNNGDVWEWGFNAKTEITYNPPPSIYATPDKVEALPTIQAIAVHSTHTVALDIDGNVHTWGENDSGQIGNGSLGISDEKVPPHLVQIPNTPKIKAIAAGNSHTIAIDTNGYMYTWGGNYYGQLGTGSMGVDELLPYKIPDTILSNVQTIAAGGSNTVALDANGYVYTWGNNWYGQLGDGTTTHRDTPALVKGFNVNTDVMANVSFKIGDTILTKLTGGGTVTANVTVRGDNGISASNAVVIMMVHKKQGDTKQDVATATSQAINPGESIPLTTSVEVPADYQNYYIRVMIWDTLNGMKQIQKSVILDSDGIR